MSRRYSWPKDHWSWPATLTHKHGVRSGRMIFTGGQADLDINGTVQHPNDVEQQCTSAMNYLFSVLHDLDADSSDLVNLVIYFIGDEHVERKILNLVASTLDASVQPAVNTIPVPQLCYPGMVVEIEGVAMRNPDGSRVERQCFHLDEMPELHRGFSHVIRCAEMLYTSDISALGPDGVVAADDQLDIQTHIMMDRLVDVLGVAGADVRDVTKLNVFYVGDGTAEDWAKPAEIRAAYFKSPGPAATGITLPCFAQPGLVTKISATAIRAENGDRCEKQFAWPEGHWDWTTPLPYQHGNRCGRMIHLGGQVSLDDSGVALDPDDMVAQTRTAMNNIASVLAEFGATLDDVVKVTTFYQGSASADALHENLLIRSGMYTEPGPATTGIPVPHLVYENMVIEIEVIAMLDD